MTTQGPDPSPATASAGAPSRSRRAVRIGVAGALSVALLAGGTVLAVSVSAGPQASTTPVAVRAPVGVPVAAVTGVTAGRVAWDAPLGLAVADGTVTAVTVAGPDGAGVPGTLTATGWTSEQTLLPDATYTGTVTAADGDGGLHALPVTAVTTPAAERLTAVMSPGDDDVVGVGKALEVTLSRDVTDPAARDAVLGRLTVHTDPPVDGAWRWMDARTLHYRPATFWAPGTSVRARLDLQRLPLPGKVWGSGGRTVAFTVGDAVVSTVDVQKHTMTVRRNGTVLRVLKASMGRPQFPTRNGVFLVLEKERHKTMDSATVNLPPGTPAYKTQVEHAVRLTYSGTFTHGAPWSVADQGVRNVSHGCINLSPADAGWFYDLVRRGDVVRVVGSTEGPLPRDPGSRDWNMSFAEWKA